MAKAGHRIVAATACALVFILVSATTHAQEEDGWKPDTHRSGAGAEIYMWSARDVGTTVPIIGFANIGVAKVFFVDVHLPLAFNINGYGNRSRAGMGNPTAAFRYAPTHGIVRWWIGGGMGAPLASVDDRDWQDSNWLAAASMALYDSHLWVVDAIPIHVTGGVDIRVAEPLSIQVGAKPIIWVPIGSRNETELILQNRVGVEYRHTPTGVGAGLMFKSFFIATDRSSATVYGGDSWQFSMEPYFAYTGDVFFVRFGLLGALDRPLGFAFKRRGVFSPHLTIGGSWD